MIKLERVKATLKPYRTIKSLREGRGEGSDPVDVTELELAIDVGGEGGQDPSFDRALVSIFGQSILAQIKAVPSRDPGGGFDTTSRVKLPDLAVSFYDFADSGGPLIPASTASTVRSRPRLKVNEKGEPTLQLRRVVYRPEAANVCKLHPYIGADFFVSVEPAQVDIADLTDATGEATSDPAAVATMRRRGKRAAAKQTDIESNGAAE